MYKVRLCREKIIIIKILWKKKNQNETAFSFMVKRYKTTNTTDIKIINIMCNPLNESISISFINLKSNFQYYCLSIAIYRKITKNSNCANVKQDNLCDLESSNNNQ